MRRETLASAKILAPPAVRLLGLVISFPFCTAPTPLRHFSLGFPLVDGIRGSASRAHRLYLRCCLQAPPAAQHKTAASFVAKASDPARRPHGWFAAPIPDPKT